MKLHSKVVHKALLVGSLLLILCSCSKSAKKIVLDFNQALIARDYEKMSKMCIIKNKDGNNTYKDPDDILEKLENLPIVLKDLEIKRVLRTVKSWSSSYYVDQKKVYVRDDNQTLLVRLLKYKHKYKVLVFLDKYYELYYLLDV